MNTLLTASISGGNLLSTTQVIGGITTKIQRCIDCPHHQMITIPDPSDDGFGMISSIYCEHQNSGVKKGYSRIVISDYKSSDENTLPTWCPIL